MNTLTLTYSSYLTAGSGLGTDALTTALYLASDATAGES